MTGFVYVATGDIYYEEARRSAATLRHHHPSHRICLITDRIRGTPFWDDVVVLRDAAFGFRDKMAMRECPYTRFVFLDTDTTIFGPLDELFELLARFDACGVQLFEGQDYIIPGIPPSFGEMNSGMLGFSKSPAVDLFFAAWENYYQAFRKENQGDHYHYANVGDQKSLRAALWESNLRIAAVGPEFNFIPFKMDFASLPVRVLHTRATSGLDSLILRLNHRLGRRAYVPLLDAVVSDNPSTHELRHLVIGGCGQLMRSLIRACVPHSLTKRLREIPWIRARFLTGRHIPKNDRTSAKWEQPR